MKTKRILLLILVLAISFFVFDHYHPRGNLLATLLQKENVAPEGSSGFESKPNSTTQKFMVSASHPLAARAGVDILKKGGTAIDAAIAVQMVLNLVEPQSSGIGGGAFLLYYDAKTGKIDAYDGREMAPQKIDPNLFLNLEGKPKEYFDALTGGKSVGTPGVLKILGLAHREHGKLPWKDLFLSAIDLAERGFPVSPRLRSMIDFVAHLNQSPSARRYFFKEDGKTPVATGEILKNPELAKTFREIAEKGADVFYTGHFAKDISDAVQNAYKDPGTLSEKDFAVYEAKKREALCAPYHEYKLCGMPPPTSGGVTVLEILGILSHFDLPTLNATPAHLAHVMLEASRLSFADRDFYLADPDFVPLDYGKLLAPDYLKTRAALIDMKKSMGIAKPGEPFPMAAQLFSKDQSPELPSTAHFSIVDAEGNAVSMTTSVEFGFGSTLMVGGFFLNNQLTDFSFVSEMNGKPVANRIEPGKRPRSSMAPFLVFDKNDNLVLVLGSPGGARIIAYLVQTLVLMLDFDYHLQKAISSLHLANRNGVTELEKSAEESIFKELLEKLGHEVVLVDMNSGLQGIAVSPYNKISRVLVGASDPRREGVAVGE